MLILCEQKFTSSVLLNCECLVRFLWGFLTWAIVVIYKYEELYFFLFHLYAFYFFFFPDYSG